MLSDPLFFVPLKNLTYFEVVSLVSFVGLSLHLVAKTANVIDTLSQ